MLEAGVRFEAGRVLYLSTKQEEGTVYDAQEALPCKVLRSARKQPARPRSAVLEGQGDGLDVEAAKRRGWD
ncbi:hypothetical protein [Archangium lansingense]|uniref:Uncharacterized protein n=1 Tax=Archangium lansingense TaxID=2995310 RepID=A0ABT3ZXI8_9BACT|nr:hypothetical protein [Archangium lansinium]MCY1074113.1 hypothetical protein [Archangium lansinium]